MVGGMLSDTLEHGGSRYRESTLKDNLTKRQSSHWQRIASLPNDAFEEELAKPEPSTAALVKRARKLAVVARMATSAAPDTPSACTP